MNFLFKALVAAYLFLTASFLFGQETIKMKKEGGVYTIPCEVNGLRLRFIFDTGASDVSISSTEAIFMLKNGYLDANDLLGSTEYQIANGDNIEGKKINLKRVKIGGKTLSNVKASIIYSSTAPLLLGQSVMNRFEEITLDYKTKSVYLGKHRDADSYYEHKIESLEEVIDSLNTELRRLYWTDKRKRTSSENHSISLPFKREALDKLPSIECKNLYNRKKYVLCIKCIGNLIDKDPNNPILYEERAKAKRQIYDFSGADNDEQIAKQLRKH